MSVSMTEFQFLPDPRQEGQGQERRNAEQRHPELGEPSAQPSQTVDAGPAAHVGELSIAVIGIVGP